MLEAPGGLRNVHGDGSKTRPSRSSISCRRGGCGGEHQVCTRLQRGLPARVQDDERPGTPRDGFGGTCPPAAPALCGRVRRRGWRGREPGSRDRRRRRRYAGARSPPAPAGRRGGIRPVVGPALWRRRVLRDLRQHLLHLALTELHVGRASVLCRASFRAAEDSSMAMIRLAWETSSTAKVPTPA